jgi:hypothetical protein
MAVFSQTKLLSDESSHLQLLSRDRQETSFVIIASPGRPFLSSIFAVLWLLQWLPNNRRMFTELLPSNGQSFASVTAA